MRIQPHHVESHSRKGNTVTYDCDNGYIKITECNKHIVHFCFTLNKEKRGGSLIDCKGNDASTRILLDDLTVRVDRDTAQMVILDKQEIPILRLLECGLEPQEVNGRPTHHLHAVFHAPDDEHYYGLGQHQLGWMDHRGKEVQLWHDYTAEGGEIIAISSFITNKRYGVLFDNASRMAVTPGKQGKTKWWAEVADAVSFFVIYGETTEQIYSGYRFLTGATPIPPLAALGYIQCKQRYKTQAEILDVARKYRAKGYPCDILVVDWFHWKTLGDLDLNESEWPDPTAMNRELRDMGYRVMISCWPRFMKDSRHFAKLEKNGWFMKDDHGKTVYGTPEDQRGALIDTTNPEAARWYWDTIRDSYAEKGFCYWWLDENEPDISPHSFQLHAGDGASVHNLYPLTHTRGVFEGHRRDLNDRCFILSRSAFHGAQQFGTTFWSSDIHPTWDVLRRQIPAGLNFCASGFAYWSSDIGGWQELPDSTPDNRSCESLLVASGKEFSLPPEQADYPELYVRWFQFGTFCPTFRTHGTRPENEVWSYGREAEKILVKYLNLRYRLLPYIYSLAYHTHVTGAPFMRALALDFAYDSNALDIKDEYMFGPAFLVAPVTQQGDTSRMVYLPTGTRWYNYWTGESYDGGQTIRVEAPIDTIPLFVRAGSIIPHGEIIQHTGCPQNNIELWVYEGSDGTFKLYRDDGQSYKYEEGDYTLIDIEWEDTSKKINVRGDKEDLFHRPQDEWLRRIQKNPATC